MTMTAKPLQQPPADNSPLAEAKRFCYAAGIPASAVPFFQHVLERLAQLESEVAALRGGPHITGVEVR